MSRIGRKAIAIPTATKVKQEGQRLAVEGPQGTLSLTVPSELSVRVSDQQVQVERQGNEKSVRSVHGLYRALIANMVQGVSHGFSKQLEITGVGYRALLQGKELSLSVGLSHTVTMKVPGGVTVEVPKPTLVIVKGADRQLVGQFAANVRGIAPPEPYKGKGIKYAGELIRRKAGKAATGAGAKGA